MDVTFWQHFTKLKLDSWKLATPHIEIVGQCSLPNNLSTAQDLVISQQSFPDHPRKKVFGGLISFLVPGILIHTNTIEEFEAFDMHKAQAEQLQHIQDSSHNNTSNANRFVLLVFGDLKNYIYYYKFVLIEYESKHVNLIKANKVSSLMSKSDYDENLKILGEKLLKEEDQIENQAFAIGEILYILDPSPKLPSSLVVNHIIFKKSVKVVLIREKLSRVSPKVTLDNSIMMELEFAQA